MATHKSDLLYWRDEAAYEEDAEIAVEAARGADVILEKAFIRMLRLERRRTERSGRAFILVLIKSEDFSRATDGKLLLQVADVLVRVTRETDLLGWYASGSTLGLLMTEIGEANATTRAVIMQKILMAVEQDITAEEFRTLSFQFRLFPQDLVSPSSGENDSDSDVYYPDISDPSGRSSYGYSRVLKRSLDIVGSLLALLVFSPVFVVIAVIVKLTSRGPVLFCQKRLGHYGRVFNFYKFRTMYSGNDPRIHQEYVSKLIAGELKSEGVFKITNDPRITPIGRFLRKSSLDELPQFFNVLKNDMSLVGPRPPLPYEFERYQTWHKRRVFEIKPGLTGLWQVKGRSRTTFDEMVRLDLRYALDHSFWYDIKILLQTPAAMFSGRGAC
jgi:lipopolysaccharide/colanic/teichoic acid biosynthesis glycosyltransferase